MGKGKKKKENDKVIDSLDDDEVSVNNGDGHASLTSSMEVNQASNMEVKVGV